MNPGLPSGMLRFLAATLFLTGIVAPPFARAETRRTRPREVVVQRAKAWAVATTAILTYRNGDRVDILSPNERTPANVEQTRKILHDWWGVDTRIDLDHSLEFLESGGHRKQFQRLGSMPEAQFRAIVGAERDSPERVRIAKLIREHYRKHGPHSLIGWDYARYIMLCRWGYSVGFLTADEAWQRIFPAAHTIQNAFHSWDELGEDYLVGRQFWSKDETERSGKAYRDIVEWLHRAPNSPWKRLPWTMPLQP